LTTETEVSFRANEHEPILTVGSLTVVENHCTCSSSLDL